MFAGLVVETAKKPAKRKESSKASVNSTTVSPRLVKGIEEDSPSQMALATTTKLPAGLSPEQKELIETLVVYQDQYELPNDEEVKKVTVRNARTA